MLRQVIALVLGFSLIFGTASFNFAGTAIGTIVAGGAMEVGGTQVSAKQIPSMSLAAGDEIATGKEAASMAFADGSWIIMEPESRIKAELRDGKINVTLLKGGFNFKSGPKQSLIVRAGGKGAVVAPGVLGDIFLAGDIARLRVVQDSALVSKLPDTGMSTGVKMFIVAGIAGAGAATATYFATREEPKRSPSQP